MKDEEWAALFPQVQETTENKLANNINSLNTEVENLIDAEIIVGNKDKSKILGIDKLKKLYGKSNPMVENMRGFFSDTVKAFKAFFTGQGYITSDGVEVAPSSNSILGSIKNSLFGIKDKITLFCFVTQVRELDHHGIQLGFYGISPNCIGKHV